MQSISDTEREKLVQSASQGDGHALQQLIVLHHACLRQVVSRHIDPHVRRYVDSDDVLQDAYVAAFKSLGTTSFDNADHFHNWLRTVARNELRNRVRALRQKKRDIARVHNVGAAPATGYPELFDQISGSDTTPSRRLARAEAAAAVLSALARLSEDQRAAVRMRFLEGLPVADIADRLQRSENAIYMLFHRGLKALRDHLESVTRYRAGE